MVEIATEAPPTERPGVQAFVVEPPAGLGQPFTALSPAFSSQHAFEIRKWSARGLTLPAAGDEVLIVFDDEQEPWAAAWWPSGGDDEAGRWVFARVATTVALPANSLIGTLIEATANGALPTVDGVSLAVGDKLLVKNQAEARKHGVYEVTSLGSAGSKWTMVRVVGMDQAAEFNAGTRIAIAEGTANGGTDWAQTTTGAIILGTTNVAFGRAGSWAAAIAPPLDYGIVEALPTSPTPAKGYVCTFKAATGIYWRLQYTGEETYPWAKVGGPPLYKTTAGGTEFNTNVYGYSNMPALKVPLTMEATTRHGALGSNRNAGTNQIELQGITGPTELTSTGAVGIGLPAYMIAVGNFNGASAAVENRMALTKNNFLFLGYKSLSALAGIFLSPWLTIDPVRVG